jgi:hypothetical protein
VAAACASPLPPTNGLGETSEDLTTSNALISNALISNALISNALISNALISNALISNALISNALISNALISNALRVDGLTEGHVARQFLAYAYSCAMRPEDSLQLVVRGVDYGMLRGALGLAPQWGREGGSCDEDCQRWISACLMARTNFWGAPVSISLRGNRPELMPDEDELREYPLREGTYFGNLFAEEPEARTLRACAGPGSNVPELTGRFCSVGGGACAIHVAMDCLNPGPPLPRPPRGEPTIFTRYGCGRLDPSSGALVDCTTGGLSIYGDDADGTPMPQAITVYLKGPVSVCGDGLCTGQETSTTCATDCSQGWSRSFGGVYNLSGGAARLPDGDVIFAITAHDTVDLGGGPIKVLRGERAVIVARYAPGGQHRWSRAIAVGAVDVVASAEGGLGRILVDGSGDIYLAAGVYGDAWLFEKKLAIELPQAEAPSVTLLVKLTGAGDLVWAQPVADARSSFMLDPEGNPIAIVTGFKERRQRIVRLARDGGGRAEVEVPASLVPAALHLVREDGAYLMSASPWELDAELRWFDPATGALEPFGVPGRVDGAALAADGGVVTIGMRLLADQTPTAELIRYAPGGAVSWRKHLYGKAEGVPRGDYPGGIPTGVSINRRGEILVVGRFFTPINLENDVLAPNVNLLKQDFFQDVWLARYAPDGRKRWVRKLGGVGDDVPAAAWIDDDDNVVVTGHFSQTGVFAGHILVNESGSGRPNTWNAFITYISGFTRK